MTEKAKAEALIEKPDMLGRAVGFTKLTKLHRKWITEMVRRKDDMTLQAHRGSYKTTCLCLAIALLMAKERGKNIIFLRKTDTDVGEVVTTVTKILQHPVFQQMYFALTGVKLEIIRSTNSEVTTNAYSAPGGAEQLQGIGIGGSLTGKHADIVITDDIVNLKDRISKAERDRTKAVVQELQNVLNRGGRFINTGTPWHIKDAFTLMAKPEKWDCYQTGLMSEEEIENRRGKMAPSLFAANYELRHIAVENALFTKAPKYFNEPEKLRDGIAQIDAAYGGEDYTAFTCGKRVGDTLFMYGRLWHSHVDTVLDVCIEKARELMCAPILCEDNGDKGFLAKEILKTYKARTYHEKENKYIKVSTYLRKWWGNIAWLEGTDSEYISQIMDYTEDAEHDDACLDGDTLIATIFGDKPIRDIRAGEYVITPAGLRKVIYAGVTGFDREVHNYWGVKATPDHKFFNKKIGFERADKVDGCNIDRISLKGMIRWKARLLSLMGKRISEAKREDIISSIQQEMQKEETRNSFIEPYGHIIMAKFLKGIISIILTGISTITIFPIWSVYRAGNIFQCTGKKMKRILSTERSKCKLLKKQENYQKHGIQARQENSGIKATLRNRLGKYAKILLRRCAGSAEIHSAECRGQNIAAKAVRKKADGERRTRYLNQKCENANFAEKNIQQSKEIQGFAPQIAKQVITGEKRGTTVYNLTVEKAGCYYANGVLVSNCDSAAVICRYYDRRSGEEYQSALFRR